MYFICLSALGTWNLIQGLVNDWCIFLQNHTSSSYLLCFKSLDLAALLQLSLQCVHLFSSPAFKNSPDCLSWPMCFVLLTLLPEVEFQEKAFLKLLLSWHSMEELENKIRWDWEGGCVWFKRKIIALCLSEYSLHSPPWPRTHHHPGLAFYVLGMQACATRWAWLSFEKVSRGSECCMLWCEMRWPMWHWPGHLWST